MISAFFPRPTFSNFDLKAKEASPLRVHRYCNSYCKKYIFSYSYSYIIAPPPLLAKCRFSSIGSMSGLSLSLSPIPSHRHEVQLICSPLSRRDSLPWRRVVGPHSINPSVGKFDLLRPMLYQLTYRSTLRSMLYINVAANADKSMQVFIYLFT